MVERGRLIIIALEQGGKGLIEIVALMACASIIVSLLCLTGGAVKISEMIIAIGRVWMPLAVLLTAAVALVLGMGIPTTAAYILCASVCAPALTGLGIETLAAHFSIFYFACLSSITPPICAAVFVASALAKSNWLRTGWQAVRLGAIAYLMAFMFLYMPELLMIGEPGAIAIASATALFGAVFFATGVTGYFAAKLRVVPRILCAVGALLLLLPGWQTDIAGIIMIVLAFGPQMLRMLLSKLRG